jgi:sugar phosphate isomerase/epimerase
MAIQYNLLQSGFKNVPADSHPTGFQLLIKTSYYRGVRLSLIDDIEVTVDGEKFERSKIRVEIGGKTYKLDQLEKIGNKNWEWLEPAIVTVQKPGGLKPGVHEVRVALKLRISYMPFNPVVSFFSDRLVLMPKGKSLASGASKPKMSVSLYSYNGDLQAGTMTLEDCLADLSDMGAEGVEFLPEAIVPNYPNPPKKWLNQWFAWMDKYKLKPIALDGGADTKLYKNRKLSLKEIVELIAIDLKLAHQLGCKVYRGLGSSWPSALDVSGNISHTVDWKSGLTPNQIYEKLLPIAEKYDVKMGEELHIPFLIESDWLEDTIKLIDKTGTRHLGFVPDMSIFVRRPPKHLSPERFIGGGVPKEVVDYVYESRENLVSEEEVKEKVLTMGAGPMGIPLVAMIYHLTYSTKDKNSADQLARLVPYSVHVHGKSYDVLEDLSDEYSIPYSEVIPVLARQGYKNYISTEYEGDRAPFMASNQVRRHQLMVRQIWNAALTKQGKSLTARTHG